MHKLLLTANYDFLGLYQNFISNHKGCQYGDRQVRNKPSLQSNAWTVFLRDNMSREGNGIGITLLANVISIALLIVKAVTTFFHLSDIILSAVANWKYIGLALTLSSQVVFIAQGLFPMFVMKYNINDIQPEVQQILVLHDCVSLCFADGDSSDHCVNPPQQVHHFVFL